MAAPKGNNYYSKRLSDGRSKIFESPEQLAQLAIDYMEECDNNPWEKLEQVKQPLKQYKNEKGEQVTQPNIVAIPTERPYSIKGLCSFLGITFQTWKNYQTLDSHKDFFEITTRIEELIQTQQFEGAAVGAFNSSIIARTLGLVDKTDMTSGGEPLKAQIIVQDKETADNLAKLHKQ